MRLVHQKVKFQSRVVFGRGTFKMNYYINATVCQINTLVQLSKKCWREAKKPDVLFISLLWWQLHLRLPLFNQISSLGDEKKFPTILSGSVLIFKSQSPVGAANIITVLLICYLYTKPAIVSDHCKYYSEGSTLQSEACKHASFCSLWHKHGNLIYLQEGALNFLAKIY